MLVVTAISASCMSLAWRDYDADTRFDEPQPACAAIGTQNLDEDQRQAVLQAASAVCDVMSSDAFKNAVGGREWLASCEVTDGERDRMSGPDVLALLNEAPLSFSVHPRKPWRAIAQADPAEPARVAIIPARIDGWYSELLLDRSMLVNTLAHEMTHLASDRFADEGHNDEADCTDAHLVSYGIGDLVEEIWLHTALARRYGSARRD